MDKTLLKASSTSYSQFLQPKQPAHSLNDQAKATVDIDFFKRSVSLHYQHLYAAKKWHNTLYRFIFFGFSFLFIILGLIIFFKTTNPICSIYFGNCSLVKNWINMLCMLLSISSFTLGYKIHPEKEAIRHLVKKMESELNSPAKQLQIEFHAIFDNLSHQWIEPHQATWFRKT